MPLKVLQVFRCIYVYAIKNFRGVNKRMPPNILDILSIHCISILVYAAVTFSKFPKLFSL